MMLVLMNQREFTTESNSNKLSIIRFYHRWSVLEARDAQQINIG